MSLQELALSLSLSRERVITFFTHSFLFFTCHSLLSASASLSFRSSLTLTVPCRHVNWRGHRRQFRHHMSSNLDDQVNTGEIAINDRSHEMNNGRIGYNGHHSNDYYFPPLRHRSHQHFSSGKAAHSSLFASSSSASSSSSSSSSSAVASDQLATRRYGIASNRFTG